MAYEVHSASILLTVEHPSISIPAIVKKMYILSEESSSWRFFIDISWQDDMSVLIMVIHIFIGVFYLVGIVWHILISIFNELND